MRLFDVLGPVMIGPSSSHTAGAARIGYTAQKLLGEVPAKADIGLYGSFATTGKGHGTDRALVAGLLGLRPDDPRLPDSFALAEEQGMTFTIHPVELRSAHPNTAVLHLTGCAGDWGYVHELRADPLITHCEDTSYGVCFYGDDEDCDAAFGEEQEEVRS